ncbi:MAG: hypothetical protein CSA11_02915 [Chloroflexi bacterium]|nr:MAG: hypothetical protein CSA11_02915 [Chloroflexota bacterium]
MKKFVIFAVLIMLLIGSALVMAQSGLPGSGFKSGQQVQNTGSTDATIVLTAYDESGVATSCGSHTVAPGGSYTYLTDIDCPVDAGFQGSAVVSSDQPIAAITNVNNKGTGAAAGQYTGTDGTAIADTIAFPLFKSDHSNRTTTFYIQNASGDANDIEATFTMNGTEYDTSFSNVPAYAMVVFSPADAGVPTGNGNIGGLVVSGTQPLAGTSLEHESSVSVASNLQASRAFVPSDYDSELACPLVRYASGGKVTTTGLQVQNVGTEDVDITVTYSIVSGSAVNTSRTINNVAPGASANFLQANDLNENTVASATVTAVASDGSGDVALAAIVNDKATATTPQRVTTYACFGVNNATDFINLPLVKETAGINTTGIQVMNVGSANATVELTYTNNNGTVVVTHSDPIAPGASKTFYNLANGGTANVSATSGTLESLAGTVNGVTIDGAGQEIVAIANESSLGNNNPQDTKNYEGFNSNN